MSYAKYIVAILLIPCFLQAVKYPNTDDQTLDKKTRWSKYGGLVSIGVWLGLEKIGKVPVGPVLQIAGIVPSFVAGQKAVKCVFDMGEYLKIHQK